MIIIDDVQQCCDNCAHFEVTEDIQCKPFAKIHRWDRPKLEIDSTDTFRCGAYHA